MPSADASDPFRPDPADPSRRVWRAPQRLYWLSVANGVATVLFLLSSAGRITWMRAMEGRYDGYEVAWTVAIALILVLVPAVIWWRRTELRGNAITLGESWLTLRPASETALLPSHADARLTVPYASVAAIETRPVRKWFDTSRVFRLLRRDGPPLFLFEDPKLDTYRESPNLTQIAQTIARRAGVPFDEHAPQAPDRHPVGGSWGWSLEERGLALFTVVLFVMSLLFVVTS